MQPIEQVLAQLPAEIVTRDPDIIAGYATDFRRQHTGRTPALLRPRDQPFLPLRHNSPDFPAAWIPFQH